MTGNNLGTLFIPQGNAFGGGNALNAVGGVLGDVSTALINNSIKAPIKVDRNIHVPTQTKVKQRTVNAAPRTSLNPAFNELDKSTRTAIQDLENIADPRQRAAKKRSILDEANRQKMSVVAQADSSDAQKLAQANSTNAQLGVQTDSINAQIESNNITRQVNNEEAKFQHDQAYEDAKYQHGVEKKANLARMAQNIGSRVGDYAQGVANAKMDNARYKDLALSELAHARASGLDYYGKVETQSARLFETSKQNATRAAKNTANQPSTSIGGTNRFFDSFSRRQSGFGGGLSGFNPSNYGSGYGSFSNRRNNLSSIPKFIF